jgi:hypothetical protein
MSGECNVCGQPCECGQFIDDLPGTVSHCFIHHEDEPIPAGGAYIVCFECKHVYPTDQDLVAAYQREYTRLDIDNDPWPGSPWWDRLLTRWLERRRVRRITADQIAFCQECIHDF